jgi:hypothetical protein
MLTPGTGVFGDRKLLEGASHFKKEPPSMSFTQFCEKYKLNNIDFLKCDIEGSEFALFCGDNENNIRGIDKIAMEVHVDSGDPENISKFLRNCGFEVWLKNNNGQFVEKIEDKYGFIYAKNIAKENK